MFAWINKITVDGSQLNACSQVCRQARKYKIDPTGGSHCGYDSFADKSEAMRFVKRTLQGGLHRCLCIGASKSAVYIRLINQHTYNNTEED